MPANLNALIRYKQIDSCLNNPFLKASISVLQEKCSDQLAEHRGIYKLVSERTIRDDIRVMRSDALGFNAPIIVNNGIYSYADEGYSIFESEIKNKELLTTIYQLLLEEKENIKNPLLPIILKALSNMLHLNVNEINYSQPNKLEGIVPDEKVNYNEVNKVKSNKVYSQESNFNYAEPNSSLISWRNIFFLLGINR